MYLFYFYHLPQRYKYLKNRYDLSVYIYIYISLKAQQNFIIFSQNIEL